MVGPAGLPPEIVARIMAREAMPNPAAKEKLADQRLKLVPDTPDELRAYIVSETRKWAKAIKDAGVPTTR